MSFNYLYKVVNSLQVRQVVISHVHTNAEIQPSVTPVNDLEVPELWEQSGISLLIIEFLILWQQKIY